MLTHATKISSEKMVSMHFKWIALFIIKIKFDCFTVQFPILEQTANKLLQKLKAIRFLSLNIMVFCIHALLKKNTTTLLTFPHGCHLREPYFCNTVISFKITWAEDLICSTLFIMHDTLGKYYILSTFCSMNPFEA